MTQQRAFSRQYAAIAIFALGYLALGFLVRNSYYQLMMTLVLPFQLQNTAIFVVFLLLIFFRPQGMFGRVTERT